MRGKWYSLRVLRVIVGCFLLNSDFVFSLQCPRFGRCNTKKSHSILQSSAIPSRRDYIDRDSYWVYMFYLLMVYKEREGNCEIAHRHEENEWKLGMWLAKQREAYKVGRLDPVYQERLEEAGVVWDPYLQQWSNMYELFLLFRDREGHCRVPQVHMEQGESLGSWLNTQRRKHRAGSLRRDQIELLEEAGVVWDVQAMRWNEMYLLLLQFNDREGHSQVPIHHEEDGRKLGNWLASQRKAKRCHNLKSSRQSRLEKAGVVFNVHSDQWEQMFKLMHEFKEREGHCQVPINHQESGKNLGHWISKQQQLYAANKLGHTYRKRMLEEAGCVSDSSMRRWESMFDLLLQFKEREGHCWITVSHREEGSNLGRWLANERKAYRLQLLDQTYQERLENAGVIWDLSVQRWECMFELLLQFKDREGHCGVPYLHKVGRRNLGRWLSRQRIEQQAGKLPDSQRRRLEESGVAWRTRSIQ